MPDKIFNLKEAFLSKQKILLASHEGIRAATNHPGTKGDHGESDWVDLLQDFLPMRYTVGPIFAVDSNGDESEQIDVGVYDKHFAPQWFGTRDGKRFVPIESVYAVFEVKPEINKDHIEYTQDKVASVRRLRRTSAPIITAGGRLAAVEATQRPIIGGILAAQSGWTADTTAAQLDKHLLPPGELGSLNIGIALDTIAFDHTPDLREGALEDDARTPPRTFSSDGNQLIYFAIRLFRQLQLIGTALSVDMGEYERHLND
jgi:hypothetical protein